MALSFNPSELGAWELTYSRKLVGVDPTRGVKVPYIEPVEIPYIPSSGIFLVGTFSIDARPTWYRAGYLTQELRNVQINDVVLFEGLPGQPDTTVDGSQYIIGLNRIQLIVLPKYSNNFSLRFEAVAWLKKLTLTIWEYRGQETDTTEELIQATRAKLETLEFKIDNLR
jgi:hypothetical protein